MTQDNATPDDVAAAATAARERLGAVVEFLVANPRASASEVASCRSAVGAETFSGSPSSSARPG